VVIGIIERMAARRRRTAQPARKVRARKSNTKGRYSRNGSRRDSGAILPCVGRRAGAYSGQQTPQTLQACRTSSPRRSTWFRHSIFSIESIAVVRSITGISVRETVPDWVPLTSAETVMVDLTPKLHLRAARRRLQHR
jgi:hypothetical protein